MACYHSGTEKNLALAGYHTYAGIGMFDTDNSIAFSCYFNSDIDPDKTDYPLLTPGRLCYPVPTDMMKSDLFVNSTTDLPLESVHDEKWFTLHYSLNHAISVFAEKVQDDDIPLTAANATHKEWLLAHGSSYRFTYIPGTYPRIQ